MFLVKKQSAQLGGCLSVREEVEARDRGLLIPILESGGIFSLLYDGVGG